MIEKAPDLKLIQNISPNWWVAFSPGYTKVVATVESLKSLSKKVNIRDVVVMKVLPAMLAYVPTVE
jgi:hypothetical protein